jgi:peptidoglycan/xylan/chitin deacetylase (PgdA/CDA1 family)
MRLALSTARAAALLLACLVLAGCQTPIAQAPVRSAAPEPSASALPSASVTTSPALSATASPDTTQQASPATQTSSVPSAAIAPLLPPIAILPQPRPARTLSGPRDLGVPVLMYHVIGVAPAHARNPDLYVTPHEFTEQLRYLSKHGYHVVTLKQVYDFWHGKATLPSKPVVLSFDDGDTPDFTIAAPLMNELHWPGCLNLIVGKKHLRLKPRIVRALIAAGWEIDSHTMNHTDVPGLSAAELRYQIRDSRKRLQELYGVPVDFFCYPSGRFDDNAVAAVKAAGYLGATTTLPGLARPNDPYRLRRVRVSGGHSASSFGSLLASAH